MVTSVREIKAFKCTSHNRERDKKRMCGREAPPLSLLLQRKEDRQDDGMVNQQYKKCIGQTRDTKVHSILLGLPK
jgi:hypothetical protein